MKIAIMQPYFFPYIGYYQLIKSVDTFYIFDDVSFIKKGWINRNKVVNNNIEYNFTIPLKNVSQNRNINEHFVSDEFPKWRANFYKTLQDMYGKSKNYKQVMNIIHECLNKNNIVDITECSLKLTSEYLGLQTNFERTSNIKDIHSKKSQRLIDICKVTSADTYVNSIGGQILYNKEQFKQNDIDLLFLQCTDPHNYNSIIHLLMNHGRDTGNLLNSYELV